MARLVQSTLKAPRVKTITVAEALFWVARIGGFSRSKNGGPAGSIVLGRGLANVEMGAQAMRILRSQRRSKPEK